MQATIELPKAFSVRDARELTLIQDLMARLNPKLLVVQAATGVHVNGGFTVNWGLVYLEGQPLKDEEVQAALEEAGLDFQHNAQIQTPRIWVSNQLDAIEKAPPDRTRKAPAMTHANSPLPYADNVETIPADEADDIQRVVQALELILTRSQAKSGQFRADVHVKTHGYAQGELRVLPNLPDELAQGLYEHDRVYPAVVRFSNSASQTQSDAIPDGRGMAIKVLDVAGDMVSADEQRGPTQDFVMINHPAFFARNVKDFLRLERVLVQADDHSLATLQRALTGGDWNPLHWHWREMLTVARIAGQLPAHPASNIYFSMAPIRFGKYVAKYRAKPAGDRLDSYFDLVKKLASQADAMRLALEETLRAQEVLFEFQVQLRTSERTMPIEDATVEWPESESPYRTVAHLLLPRQEIALLRQQDACTNLSFNVWHALADHRPLGGINRVRRSAYAVSSAWRRQRAGVKSEEP